MISAKLQLKRQRNRSRDARVPHDPWFAATRYESRLPGAQQPHLGMPWFGRVVFIRVIYPPSARLQRDWIHISRQHQQAFKKIVVPNNEFAFVGRIMRPRVRTLVEATLGEYPRDALILRGSRGQ